MVCRVPDNIADIWNRKTVHIRHDLQANDLFTPEALTELVRENPDSVRECATMDNSAENAESWKKAELASSRPEDLFKAIESGVLWTNLGNVGARDSRYQKLLDGIMETLESSVPELSSFNRQIGIIISSPNARVFYHVDIPGQGLLHIHGEKKLWLYPGQEPYLNQRDFERVTSGRTAEEITYDPSFENAATEYDLKPGDGLFWPLNWPHRVVNGPTLNVSATVEYHTRKTRRHYAVNYANALMSEAFGYRKRSQAVSGPGFWTKAALGYALRRSRLADRLILKS